jgi:hypothetical protein
VTAVSRSATATEGPADALARLRERARDWADTHRTLLRRLRVAHVALLWLALAYVAAIYLAVPEARPGLRAWLGCYWLLVVWFLLARTKALSWRAYALLFAVAVPWAVVIAVVTTALTAAAGAAGVAADGPRTAIAALGEEALKLVPLAVLAATVPDRVRRFAAVDWLLAGVALGLGFQAFEDLVRRIVVAHEGGAYERLSVFLTHHGPGQDSGFPQYGWSPLAGGSSVPGAGYAGHHVFTGLACAGIGLGIAAWRHSRSRPAPGGIGVAAVAWRVVALAVPLALWCVAALDHFGFNASLRGLAWVGSGDPTVPWVIRAAWQAAGHGYGRAWLLLALLAVLTALDARRLAAAARAPGGDLLAGSPWTPRTPAAFVVRDAAFVVVAHAREAGEPLRTALARGRAAGTVAREGRLAAYDRAPGATPSRTQVRVTALAALSAVAVVALVAGPWLAHVVGPTLSGSTGLFGDAGPWLAGLLDRLAEWWDGRSLSQQIGLGLGVAALVVLSGGSLGLGLGVSGALAYLAEHGHGAADLTRDPRAAVRGYLATTTPAAMALDAAGLALTFGPARLARAPAGAARAAVDDYAAGYVARHEGVRLLPGAAEGPPPLDAGEFAAVRYYTGRGYARVNTALRTPGEPVPPEVHARIEALSSALTKLPDHIGWVHRGADLTPGQLARYRPGAVIREQPFTSTAVMLEDRFAGNTHFVIRSYSGRDVSVYSQVPAEREVLFDRRTRFKVMENMYDRLAGEHVVVLMEVR